MPFVVIEDKALGPLDVGLFGAVGIVPTLSRDSTGAELHPFDRLRAGAHLIEQLFRSLCHANLHKSGFAQGTELLYNFNWSCKES